MPLDQVILNSADARDLRMMIAGIQSLLDLEKYLGFSGFSARFDKRPNCTLAVFLQPNDAWFERLRLSVDGLNPGEPAIAAMPPDQTEGIEADTCPGNNNPASPSEDPLLASTAYATTLEDAAASGAADIEPEPPADPPSVGDAVADPIPAAADGGGAPDITAPAISHPEPEIAPAAGTAWTADEDERLIQLTVNGMLSGLNKAAALREAARTMGRGEEAVKFRIYKHHIAARLNATLAEAEAAAPAAPPQPAASQAASPPPPSAIDAHLWGLPRGGQDGWTWSRDAELMQLACNGYGTQDIAVDLGLDSAAVKTRFDLLTGNHKDKDDRWVRLFTREDVLSALEAHIARNPGADHG